MPTAERWQKIEELFHGVLERGSAASAHFLDEACAGDEELRYEVDSLLEQTGLGMGIPRSDDATRLL